MVAADTFSFCPNGYQRQRLSDDSPLNPSYPSFCNEGPFTKGSVWGIDDGWATGIIGDYYYRLGWKAERRNYTLSSGSTRRGWTSPTSARPTPRPRCM